MSLPLRSHGTELVGEVALCFFSAEDAAEGPSEDDYRAETRPKPGSERRRVRRGYPAAAAVAGEAFAEDLATSAVAN